MNEVEPPLTHRGLVILRKEWIPTEQAVNRPYREIIEILH